MSIRKKLIIGFGVIIFWVIAVSASLCWQNRRIEVIVHQGVFDSISHLDAVWSLMEAQEHLEIVAKDHLFMDQSLETARVDYFLEKERLQKIYQRYSEHCCEHVQSQIKAYYGNIENFYKNIEEAFALKAEGAAPELIKAKLKDASAYIVIAHENMLEQIIAHVYSDHIEPSKRNLTAILDRTVFLTLMMCFLALLSAVGIGFYIYRTISVPITKFTAITRQIGSGDLNTTININSNDEIGILGKAFAEMLFKLKQTTASWDSLNKELESKVIEETTKRREHEAMLIQQAKLAAMGEMVNTIAHQWRQPLNTLGLCLQNINDAYQHDELAPDYFARTSRKAMNQIGLMSRTIDDFRNFFKPDKVKTTFNSMQAVGKVLTLVSPQLEAHGVGWQLTCATLKKTFTRVDKIISCPETEIEGYPNEFEHVILNLINNAKDAILEQQCLAESGRLEEGLIDITFSREGQLVVIRISDNGIGIRLGLKERIFEPYFTTKEQSHGTGLGLYICKVIIEEHMYGKLTNEDRETGACFTIKISGMGKDRHE